MELTTTHQIFVMIVGVFTGLIGIAIGLVLGYFIGRHEERGKQKVWDFDKLKRSDHYHFDRKRNKTIK